MKFPTITTKQEFDEYFKSDVWIDAAKLILRRHQISFNKLNRAEHGEHIVFLIDNSLVLKIYKPFRAGFEREKTALEFANGKTSIRIPEIIAVGEFEYFDYLIMTQLAGELMKREIWLTLPEKEQIAVLTELAVGLKELHSHNADSFDFDWHKFVELQAAIALERQIAARVNPEWIDKLPHFIETNLKLLPQDLPTVFLHGDVHFGNLRLQKLNGEWRISGLFDFADSLCGFHEFDFLAVGLLMIQGQSKLQREFFKAYGYAENDLDEAFRKRLMLLTVLYECSDLRRYAMRLAPEAVEFSFEKLEKSIWSFADKF
ncbi:MAG: aminoglycoside phosphotransferase family protein [Pyrinomonadaceae bacterium]